MNRVTFFTKPECTLCRSALYVLQRVRHATPFELETIDITDPAKKCWFDRYRNDIPVVHLNGREVFRHRVDERRLRELLSGKSDQTLH